MIYTKIRKHTEDREPQVQALMAGNLGAET